MMDPCLYTFIDKLEAEIKGIKIEIGDKALELFAKGTALDPAIDELVKKIEGVTNVFRIG